MPIIKSAIKRVKQQHKRTVRNVRLKREIRQSLKAFNNAIALKDKKQTAQTLQSVYSVLDKAVKKNLYHKNKTARMKAKYAKLASEITGKATTTKKAVTPKTPKPKTKTTKSS